MIGKLVPVRILSLRQLSHFSLLARLAKRLRTKTYENCCGPNAPLQSVRKLAQAAKAFRGGGCFAIQPTAVGTGVTTTLRGNRKPSRRNHPVVCSTRPRRSRKPTPTSADGIDPSIRSEQLGNEPSGSLNDGAGCLTRSDHLHARIRSGNAIMALDAVGRAFSTLTARTATRIRGA